MGTSRRYSLASVVALAVCGTCASASVRLLGVSEIGQEVANSEMPVGGVSGIDYNQVSDNWYLISDDKSEHGPARYWRATITLTHQGPPRLRKLHVVPILQPDGRPYPAPGHGEEALDSESIRKVPGSRQMIWSSEGDARDGFGPAIRLMSGMGRSTQPMPLPAMFAFDPVQARGPRANLSIEGISFEPGSRYLWASLEAPLVEDGGVASRSAGATIRLSRLRYPDLKLDRQFGYTVDPIGPAPDGRLADNGVSEIIVIESQHILVLERSGVQQDDGDFAYHSRLYCADLRPAQDIANIASLRDHPVALASKRLVYDFANVASPRIDNVEGMTLGPQLHNGHRTIVFVTDNDFSPRRRTQLIALEVLPPRKGAGLVESLCMTPA